MGVVAATVTTIVVLVTALGFARNPVWSIQRGGSVWLVSLWFTGISVLMIAVWAARIEHPYASVGLAVTTAGLLVPFWAEWPWPPDAVRVAVLGAAPFAVSGAAHVVLRWSVRPGPVGALWMVYLLAGAGSVIHLVGYDPFEEPACARTCTDIRPFARSILSTRSAVTTTCLLTVLASLVAAFAIGRARPTSSPFGPGREPRHARRSRGLVGCAVGQLGTSVDLGSVHGASPGGSGDLGRWLGLRRCGRDQADPDGRRPVGHTALRTTDGVE